MNKIYKLTLLAICFLENFATFAQSRYHVEVNSFGEYDMNGKTFVIIPSDENVNSTDLEFKEYSGYICRTLASTGAREVYNILDADVCILMHYEITNQSYTETVSVPVWGKTGISSITTNTYSTGNSNTYADASVSAYGNSAYGSGSSYTSGNENTTSTTNVNYSYGISGYKNVQRHVENYLRVINLYAYDNKHTDNPIILWKSNIMSEGTSNDIRKIIPYMSYVAMEGVNNNIHGNWYLETPHSSFDVFNDMKIRGENVYVAPVVEYFSNEYLKIVSIERKPNETVVTFFKPRKTDNVSFSSNAVLEYNGNKIKPIGSRNIRLGKRVRNSKNMLFNVIFPTIPKTVNVINISEEEDLKIKNPHDRKYWKNIHLEK